jgi:hypothetical protein
MSIASMDAADDEVLTMQAGLFTFLSHGSNSMVNMLKFSKQEHAILQLVKTIRWEEVRGCSEELQTPRHWLRM